MNLNRVVIVVSTYKDVLSETEKISLKQLKKILGVYDIHFVYSQHLNAEYLLGYKLKKFVLGFHIISRYGLF
jgi:hypothetical protein